MKNTPTIYEAAEPTYSSIRAYTEVKVFFYFIGCFARNNIFASPLPQKKTTIPLLFANIYI